MKQPELLRFTSHNWRSPQYHSPMELTLICSMPPGTEVLICLVCAMADRLYPMLHQLLSSREPEQLTQQRWQLFHERLRDLIEERMNQRREAVVRLLTMEPAGPLHRELISTLAFCAGPGGIDRLRATLLDPTP